MEQCVMDQERRPESLFGVVLDAYWTSLAHDPLSTLLLTGLLSLGGVLVVLLGHIVGDLAAQLVRALA
jgi:putative lipase involved disintegration of autophagic bodies